jgi:hypothetical protein
MPSGSWWITQTTSNDDTTPAYRRGFFVSRNLGDFRPTAIKGPKNMAETGQTAELDVYYQKTLWRL